MHDSRNWSITFTRVLTRPDLAPAAEPVAGHGAARQAEISDAAACAPRRGGRPARNAGGSQRPRRYVPSGRRAVVRDRRSCCPSWMPPPCWVSPKLEEGDVEITPAGREFAEADILRRKELFRTAALEQHRADPRDHPFARSPRRPYTSRWRFRRSPRRTFQRRGSQGAIGNGDRLGPLRGVVRSRFRYAPVLPSGRDARPSHSPRRIRIDVPSGTVPRGHRGSGPGRVLSTWWFSPPCWPGSRACW